LVTGLNPARGALFVITGKFTLYSVDKHSRAKSPSLVIMKIPEKTNNIIQRIRKSEDEWKALHMGAWGYAKFYLEPKFKNTDKWEKPRPFRLPASNKGYQEYTPAGLYGILTSKDTEFTLGHLQTLFSLLEELIDELCPIVCNGQEIKSYKFEKLTEFLLGIKPYQNFQTNITEDRIKELKLAKETRNCFIHNDSKVDEPWLKAFKEVNGRDSTAQIGDELPVNFHQIEGWHELIIEIVDEIKDSVIRL
jgi:hypothetical protein